MGNLASSLIEGTEVQTKWSSMVRGLSREDDGTWILRNGQGEILGEADWLVVAGSGIAHPRWTATFGNEVRGRGGAKRQQKQQLAYSHS